MTSDPTTPPDSDLEHRSRRGWIVAAVVLLVAALGVAQIVRLSSERDDQAAEIERLDEALQIARGDLGAEIDRLESEVARLTADVEQLETELATTTTDLSASRTEVDDLTQRLDERRAERDELQAQIDELAEIVDLVGTEITPMPDLLGIPIEQVTELATELGMELVVVETRPTNVIARPGDVIEQLPLLDTPLVPGNVIWVEVYVAAEAETGD